MAITPGPQFSDDYVELFRGMRHVKASDALASGQPVGVHWTGDPEIARSFTMPRKDEKVDADTANRIGTVLRGFVHKNDLMTEDDIREWNKQKGAGRAILPSDTHSEKESPVKPGATVHVVGAKDVNYVPSNRSFSGWEGEDSSDYSDYEDLNDAEIEPGERKA